MQTFTLYNTSLILLCGNIRCGCMCRDRYTYIRQVPDFRLTMYEHDQETYLCLPTHAKTGNE